LSTGRTYNSKGSFTACMQSNWRSITRFPYQVRIYFITSVDLLVFVVIVSHLVSSVPFWLWQWYLFARFKFSSSILIMLLLNLVLDLGIYFDQDGWTWQKRICAEDTPSDCVTINQFLFISLVWNMNARKYRHISLINRSTMPFSYFNVRILNACWVPVICIIL